MPPPSSLQIKRNSGLLSKSFHSWQSNNTRTRSQATIESAAFTKKCINNIHKEPMQLKKLRQKALPTNAPSSSFHARGKVGVRFISPLIHSEPSSRYSIAERVRRILVKYPYFRNSFIEKGLKNHTHTHAHTLWGYGPRSGRLLWANASLAHQFLNEWWKTSPFEGLARKMAGIVPLSTFDLTSMQQPVLRYTRFHFLPSGFYILLC